jgi:two-component system response regulator LytT
MEMPLRFFERVPTDTPVIFTTAYDQYAIKAFKQNSIDYLLKPIDEDDLVKSLEKISKTHPVSFTAN